MKKTSKFKSGYKALFVIIIFMTMTSPLSISAARSIVHIVTHGDEIENFKPYTLEQCRIDAAKIKEN